MRLKTREIQYFFFSQYFSDAIRITLGVLLPPLIFAQFGQLETGLAISVGAFGTSLTDSPGPLRHRRNGILICCFFIALVALVTDFARMNDWTLGVEILLFSFFFSMFTIYGNRAAAIGTAALLVMVLLMNQHFGPEQPGLSALLALAGGLWYLLLSLAFSQIGPYRPAQQALGECIHEVARFLRVKARFYSTATNLDEDYRQLVAQQVVVSEKQDAVREMLFKSRQMVKEFTNTGRTLVLTFVDVVDLYEQITKIHYDYASLRDRFGNSGILEEVTRLIQQMADELDDIGFAIQSDSRYRRRIDISEQLEQLKSRIDAYEAQATEGSSLALKKILVNIRNLAQRLHDIQHNYSTKTTAAELPQGLEYARFVSHQNFSLSLFRDNLSLRSSIFKHAIRVAVAAIAGFLLARGLDYGHHGYWIILTVIFILKPGFSLTRQRNYQRLIGTLAGGVIGVLILLFVPDMRIQFVFLLIAMVGTYSFLRINYTLMVLFVTPFVLILFNFMGAGSLGLVEERVVDTLIGCGIAFAANYLVFPSWESDQLQRFMLDVTRANTAYLQKLYDGLSGQQPEVQSYKLARKQVYVSSANLSAAFQRMTTEPKKRQKNSREVYEFVVLNHLLSSYIATVASGILENPAQVYPADYSRPVKRALAAMQESLRRLDPKQETAALAHCLSPAEGKEPTPQDADTLLLKEQLNFIQKLSLDICKTTEAIFTGPAAKEKESKRAVLH